jgi:aminoglycoside 6'-N-acetyltransferase
VLRGERVLLRPLAEEDVPALVELLGHPEVASWWGPHDAERVRADLLHDEQTESLAVELDGELIGVVLIAEENEPDYRHAGLDISIRADLHGQGLGRESLRVAIDHLVEERGHHRFTIDPSAANERAIRCYSAVGFRPVGLMRNYERAEDGMWRDGLLMDLLAEELRR